MDVAGIYVLIPAYNADQTIGPLINEIAKTVPPSQILVVDDGSTDETGRKVLQLGARLLRHEKNRGKGSALMTGFRSLLARDDCEAVITLDADLQHHPDDLPGFIAHRKVTRANLILGSRVGKRTGMPPSRRMSNTLTSFLVSSRIGTHIPDSQCGYRLIGREVLESVKLDSSGYEAETELIVKSARKGFTFDFVPVRTIYAGERSHMTPWETTRRFIHVLMQEV